MKIVITAFALCLATAGFSQSTNMDTTSGMRKSGNSKMHMHRNHSRMDSTGAGDISSPGNSSSSNRHVTSNGTNGLDRTTGNGTYDSTGRRNRNGMKMKSKKKTMSMNSADSTQ